jgi:hypothetical protein
MKGMKGLRVVIQNSDGKELFVKRISLPFAGAKEFSEISKGLYVDLCEIILTYQRSQTEGIPFKQMLASVRNAVKEEREKLMKTELEKIKETPGQVEKEE